MRSTKFYRKNEYETMKALGLKPTKGSGSGWIEKADGQNEKIICELKSTDADSYRIKKYDLEKLKHHALVSNKIPVFAIQFLETNEVYLLMKPDTLQDVCNYIETGEYEPPDLSYIDVNTIQDTKQKKVINKIKSNPESRNAFWEEKQKQWKR